MLAMFRLFALLLLLMHCVCVIDSTCYKEDLEICHDLIKDWQYTAGSKPLLTKPSSRVSYWVWGIVPAKYPECAAAMATRACRRSFDSCYGTTTVSTSQTVSRPDGSSETIVTTRNIASNTFVDVTDTWSRSDCEAYSKCEPLFAFLRAAWPDPFQGFQSIMSPSNCSTATVSDDKSIAWSSFQQLGVPTPFRCAEPLVVVEDDGVGVVVPDTKCAYPCNSVIFSANTWQQAETMTQIVVTFCFVLNTYVVLSFLLFDRQKPHLMYYMVILYVMTFMQFVSLGYYGYSNYRAYQCKNRTSVYEQKDALESVHGFLISLQSVLTSVLTLAANGMWLIIGRNLWFSVCFSTSITNNLTYVRFLKYVDWFQVVVFPCIFGVVQICLGYAGGVGVLVYPALVERASDWVSIPLFYTPLTVNNVIGTFFIAHILRTMYVTSNNVADRKNKLKKYWRILTFLGQAWFIYVFTAMIYFIFRSQEHDVNESSKAWISCLLVGGNKDVCGELPSTHFNQGLWMLTQMSLIGSSVAIFLIYGTQTRHLQQWRNLGQRMGSILSPSPLLTREGSHSATVTTTRHKHNSTITANMKRTSNFVLPASGSSTTTLNTLENKSHSLHVSPLSHSRDITIDCAVIDEAKPPAVVLSALIELYAPPVIIAEDVI